MFKHLLVPTDGSPLSQATVTQAVAFAQSCGARITFFHAAPNVPAIQGGAGALSDPTIAKAFHEKVDAAANQALSAAAAQSAQAHVACDTVLVHGNQPAEAIVQAASQQGCEHVTGVAGHVSSLRLPRILARLRRRMAREPAGGERAQLILSGAVEAPRIESIAHMQGHQVTQRGEFE